MSEHGDDLRRLALDSDDIAADLHQLRHGVRVVRHVASRETMQATLDAAVELVQGVGRLLRIEADDE